MHQPNPVDPLSAPARGVRSAGAWRSGVLVFGLCGLLVGGCDSEAIEQPPDAASLQIDPVLQQTEVWCWAATVEMVLRHFGLPNLNEGGNYQCGVVAVYALVRYGAGHPCTFDCRECEEPINGMPAIEALVEQYGREARRAGLSSPILSAASVPRRLTALELMREIAGGSPVVAAVSFDGTAFPEANDHVVVLTAYSTSSDGTFLTVNDPYPYDRFAPASENPYIGAGGRSLGAGQYEIELQAFAARFGWAGSLYRIRG